MDNAEANARMRETLARLAPGTPCATAWNAFFVVAPGR